jgi:putative transposase
MASPKRKFTDEQKLEILRQANEMGVITVIRNHNLSYSVFARWREKFVKKDQSKLDSISRKKAKSEFKHIMEENSQLKRIIADQALELKRKDEELKRMNQSYSRR